MAHLSRRIGRMEHSSGRVYVDEVDWIDILKLRVGYGQTSNQAVDPLQDLGTLGNPSL